MQFSHVESEGEQSRGAALPSLPVAGRDLGRGDDPSPGEFAARPARQPGASRINGASSRARRRASTMTAAKKAADLGVLHA
jgi:hypothetical protein